MADPEVPCPGERLEDEAYPKSREAFPEEEEEDEEEDKEEEEEEEEEEGEEKKEDEEEEGEEEEEEDSVGDLPPEGCLGAGCRSKVEARSSEVNWTQLPHEWTQEVVLFRVVEAPGEGA